MPHDATALHRLLDTALASGDATALERHLLAHAADPRLDAAFASQLARIVTAPDPPTDRLAALLDRWATLDPATAPGHDPRALLPAIALLACGQLAISRPDWWADQLATLRRGATDPRPQSRASVVTALQQLLAADPTRTRAALAEWRRSNNQARATVAADILANDLFPDLETTTPRKGPPAPPTPSRPPPSRKPNAP